MSAGGKCGESRTNNSSLVEAMLAEYGTLRQESLEAVGHRMTVMSFTFAAVGVIIGGLLTRKVSDAVAGLIAVLFVPQVSKAALLIWLGKVLLGQRETVAVEGTATVTHEIPVATVTLEESAHEIIEQDTERMIADLHRQ